MEILDKDTKIRLEKRIDERALMLNKVSNDITRVENFLRKKGFSEEISHHEFIDGNVYKIFWKVLPERKKEKYRLYGEIQNFPSVSIKPVIEWDIKNRKIFHEMLSNFLSML